MTVLPEFDPGFTTAAMQEIFCARSRVRRMVDVEVALAHAAHVAHQISADAFSAIDRAAREMPLDEASVLERGWTLGTPVIALVETLRARLPPEHAHAVHVGATSQDIIDTATVLQVRDALVETERLVERLCDLLARLAERHQHTWVAGRTLLVPALPIRLSTRLSTWLVPLLAHLEALAALRVKLPVQLGGPVGDLSSFGDAAAEILATFAQRLSLRVPNLAWHTDRGPLRQVAAEAVAIVATLQNIATNLILLAQAELGEVTMRGGGSSSMPHKQNPADAVRAVAAARVCVGVASILHGASAHELERSAGAWQAESFAIPLVMQTLGAALEATTDALSTAVFQTERARANLVAARMSVPNRRATDGVFEARVEAEHARVKAARQPTRVGESPVLSWDEVGPTRVSTPTSTVVLIHSLGLDSTLWRDQVKALSEQHRVITLDLRGHGRSPTSAGPYSLEQLGSDVVSVMDQACVVRASVVGISIGGLVGLWLAVHAPTRVNALVAANTAARIGSEAFWRQRIETVEREGLLSIASMLVARWVSGDVATRDARRLREIERTLLCTDPRGYVAACAALATADLTTEVSAIHVPTLIVAGALDSSTTVSDAQALHAQIKGSQLAVIEGAAHLSNIDRADAFNARVSEFLRQLRS